MDRKNYQIISIIANPTVSWRLNYPLYNALRYANNGIIFPGQRKAKGEQNNGKDLCDARIRKRMAKEGKSYRQKRS